MDEILQALRWGRFFDGLMAARLFCHLERGCVPVWETDGRRFDDTLSREISCLNASCTMVA